MDNTTLHAILRDELAGKPFTVARYAGLLREYCPKYWARKHFRDFDYLKVSINPSWFIVGLVLSIALGVGSYILIEGKVFGRGR
jgi:hypothetical protein